LSTVNVMIQLLLQLPVDRSHVLFKDKKKKKKIQKKEKQYNERIKVEMGKEIELSSFFVFHAIEIHFHSSFVCFCFSHL